MKAAFLSHTANVSGAERSLLELLNALPDEITPVLLSPTGELPQAAAAVGVPTAPIAGFEASFRLHPVHTPRALRSLARSAFEVRAICKREGVDVVHANTARAGLIAAAARPLGIPPFVTMIRDALPPGLTAAVTRAALRRGAAAIVANSAYIAEDFGGEIEVVHPPVSLSASRPDEAARLREEVGVPPDAFAIGVVAQITPWKRQDTAIRALELVRREIPSAVLLVVGEAKFKDPGVRFDNPGYEDELRSLADELAPGAVRFLGERTDIAAVMGALDVLLVPSAAEPFGRVAVEGMLSGTPVVATSAGGTAEIIEDGHSGLLVPPGRPAQWAEAVLRLSRDDDLGRRIGENGERRGRELSPEAHVRAMAGLYASVARRRSGAA